METLKMNLALVQVLKKWDPFQAGEDFYEPEIADVMLALRDMDTENCLELAKKIQAIYEFSFEKNLDMKECINIAEQLYIIINQASCSI